MNNNKAKARVEDVNHDIDIFGGEFSEPRGKWGHHRRQEHAFRRGTRRRNHSFSSLRSFSSSIFTHLNSVLWV